MSLFVQPFTKQLTNYCTVLLVAQVLERFTIEHMVTQYADLYSDLFFDEAS